MYVLDNLKYGLILVYRIKLKEKKYLMLIIVCLI